MSDSVREADDRRCLVGSGEFKLGRAAHTGRIGGWVLSEGDVICLDTEFGLVLAGVPAAIAGRPNEGLQRIASWRDAHSIATGTAG